MDIHSLVVRELGHWTARECTDCRNKTPSRTCPNAQGYPVFLCVRFSEVLPLRAPTGA
jgi:hypothetical protein